MRLISVVVGIASVLSATSAFAGSSTVEQEWSFLSNSSNMNSYVSGSNELTGQQDGISLNISAWSSSWWGGNYDCRDGSSGPDKCIQRTTLTRYNGGLGNINGDERNDTPNHSIDNNDQDYDMILLSFSEAVNISSLTTGWNYSYTDLRRTSNGNSYSSRTQNDAQASVIAFEGTDVDNATNFGRTETWSDILNRDWTSVGEAFDSASDGTIPVVNNIFSRFWLVGAAHAVNRDAGHITDHFKLSGVTFARQPTTGETNVSAPATIALSSLGLLVFLRRKLMK